MATTQKESQKETGGKHLINEEHDPSGIGGKIEMAEHVVSTIAGLACREIPGIYKMGKSTLIPFRSDDPKRGVGAEVGMKEAAVDLEVVLEYGYDIRQMANSLRQKIAEQVQRMAGRKVVEVNIDVVDVHLPEPDKDGEPEEKTRARVV